MTRQTDRGFATVWVVSAIAVVVMVAIVAGLLGEVAVNRHRAAAAADAAALAAALAAIEGPSVACGQGAALAQRNRAQLTECVLDGAVATVTVAVSLPGMLARFGPATARARAGPAAD